MLFNMTLTLFNISGIYSNMVVIRIGLKMTGFCEGQTWILHYTHIKTMAADNVAQT